MKRCPKCGQTYPDQDINFCLNDGELLTRESDPPLSPFDVPTRSTDDSPPTLVMNQAKVTNPIGWHPPVSPPAQWQKAQPAVYPFTNQSPSQVLPMLSLIFGLCSITVGLCCYSGVLIAPVAIVMGIVGLVQNKSNPDLYGGRGLAIGGIAAGAAYFVFLMIYIVIMALLSFS